jgi:hypothetical protein
MIGDDGIHRLDRSVTGDLITPHVAEVEETGPLADGVMLGGQGRVPDRHLVAPELYESGAELHMDRIQDRLLHWFLFSMGRGRIGAAPQGTIPHRGARSGIVEPSG